MKQCWFLNPHEPVVHILLGPHGDLIQMLPAWREHYALTERKVFVVVSEQYSDTLDGVSYVDVFPYQGHWSKDVPKAREYAMSRWCTCRVIQWWNDTNPIPMEFRGSTHLNCRGRDCRINIKQWRHYGHSMWERAGFPDERDMLTFRLVFDCRQKQRESQLIARFSDALKPLLLYNFTAKSSPFGYVPEVWSILQPFRRDFKLLDLGTIRAERIYDLLGLYDIAAGLLTCDTATLHLAAASNVPYIAWTQNGWCGSVPKGNCVLRIPYAETIRRLPDVRKVLDKWRLERASTSQVLVPQIG